MALFAELSFSCPECSSLIEEGAFLSGPELVTYVACRNCWDSHEVRIYESPAGVSAEVVGSWTQVDVQLSTYRAVLDSYQPGDPHGTFLAALHEVRDLMRRFGDPEDGANVLNRMIFLQYITALEAYLADRLIEVIGRSSDARLALIKAAPALTAMKFPLAAIEAVPDLAQAEVKRFLQHVSFHDLDQVDRFYRAVLGVSIFASEGDKKLLLSSIAKRHDCVHRNGKTPNGTRHDDFDLAYITRLDGAVSASITLLETVAPRARK